MTVRKRKRDGLGRPPLPSWLALGFVDGDGDGFGELEGQVRVSSENGIVYLLLMALDLRLVFVGWAPRVGRQVAVHTVDDRGGEYHLQLVLLGLQDAASDRRAPRKHGLSVHLDRLDKAGRESITPVILVALERLADRRGDVRALGQGDELEPLSLGRDGGRRGRRSFGCIAAGGVRVLVPTCNAE